MSGTSGAPGVGVAGLQTSRDFKPGMQRKTSRSASTASERVALDSWVSSDSHFVPKRASLNNTTQMDSNQPPRPPLSKSGFSLGALGGWGRSLAASGHPATAAIDWPGSRLNPHAPSFAAMAVTGPFPAPHLLPSLAAGARRASSSRASNLSASKTATPNKPDVTRLTLPENEIPDTCSEGGYDFASSSNGARGSTSNSNSTYSTPRQSSSGAQMDWHRFGHSLRTTAAAAAAAAGGGAGTSAGRPPSMGSGSYRAPSVSGGFSPAASLGLPETPGLRSPECSPPRRTLSSSSLPPPPCSSAGPFAAGTLPQQNGRNVRHGGGDSKPTSQQLMYVYGMEDAYLGGIVQREVEEARRVQVPPTGRMASTAQPVPDYLVPTIAVKARSLVILEEDIPNTATTAYATPKTDVNVESHCLAPQLAGLTAILDLLPDSEKPPEEYLSESKGKPTTVKDEGCGGASTGAVDRETLVDTPTRQLLLVLVVRLYCAAVRQPAAAAIIAAVVACMAWWVVFAGVVLCGIKGGIHLARLPVAIAAAVAMWAVGRQGA